MGRGTRDRRSRLCGPPHLTRAVWVDSQPWLNEGLTGLRKKSVKQEQKHHSEDAEELPHLKTQKSHHI